MQDCVTGRGDGPGVLQQHGPVVMGSLRSQGRHGESFSAAVDSVLDQMRVRFALPTLRTSLAFALSHSRNAMRPGFSIDPPSSETRGRREGRVPFAPMVRVQQKKHAAEPQVRAGTPGLPCAMVLRLIRVLPGETGLCCHRRRRDAKHHRQFSTCIGAPGPHDFAVRDMLFVVQRIASIASRFQRS
jgi:hypothetical protein